MASQFTKGDGTCHTPTISVPRWPQIKTIRVRLTLTDQEHALLEKLADAGQPTELRAEELTLGKVLENRGLVFFVRDTASAVITPRGRHVLAGEPSPKPGKKPPLGFLN